MTDDDDFNASSITRGFTDFETRHDRARADRGKATNGRKNIMSVLRTFLSGLATTALVLAGIQGLIMVGHQAYADYGWLGVLVLAGVGVPFFPILPVVGWWFLPFAQMMWLMVFLVVFLLASLGAAGLDKMTAPRQPY